MRELARAYNQAACRLAEAEHGYPVGSLEVLPKVCSCEFSRLLVDISPHSYLQVIAAKGDEKPESQPQESTMKKQENTPDQESVQVQTHCHNDKMRNMMK